MMSVTRAFWVMEPYFVSITTSSPSPIPCFAAVSGWISTSGWGLFSRSLPTHR